MLSRRAPLGGSFRRWYHCRPLARYRNRKGIAIRLPRPRISAQRTHRNFPAGPGNQPYFVWLVTRFGARRRSFGHGDFLAGAALAGGRRLFFPRRVHVTHIAPVSTGTSPTDEEEESVKPSLHFDVPSTEMRTPIRGPETHRSRPDIGSSTTQVDGLPHTRMRSCSRPDWATSA
jgi:hypothetical protein